MGDGPRNNYDVFACRCIVPESLQMSRRGELKRRLSRVGGDNDRDADGELGLDTKAFFAGENAGLQQPGGPSLPFKSPTRLGYQRFTSFFNVHSFWCDVMRHLQLVKSITGRYMSNNSP